LRDIPENSLEMMRRHHAGRARRGAALLAAVGTFAAALDVYGRSGSCEPVRVASDLSKLRDPWRAALEALVHATAQEGLPWSCPGGSVALAPGASGSAELTITDAGGRTVSRRVAGPGEVVPTGEALLASLIVEPPPPPSPPVEPPRRADPRAQLQALIGPRVSGPGAMAWGSGQGRVIVPFGPWSLSFWGRYDVHLAGPTGSFTNLGTSAVSAGLGAGRQILSGPFELRATIDPSLAVVLMESGYENLPHPEGAKVAFRLGTALSALFPIAGVFRGVVSLDGEFAPAGVNGGLGNIDTHDQPPQLPPVPVYTAGLLLGIEATLR
jgi:hypothetical protein